MSKKILIVTGSPRQDGNTDLLAQAMKAGAEQAGHSVTIFEAGKKNIRPCLACGGCYTQGKPCVAQDDFNQAEQALLECDVIILATPLYWYTFSAQMKAFIDKLAAFGKNGHSVSGKESMLVACGAVADESRFSGLVETYHQMCKGSLQWENKGILICTSCGDKGTVSQQMLDQAKAMAASL